MNKNLLSLSLELVVIFLALPFLVYFFALQKIFFFALWGIAIYCFLHSRSSSNLREFKTPIRALKQNSLYVLKRLFAFIILSISILIFTSHYFEDRLFDLPKNKTSLWVLIMFLYPFLSVIPQEIIYRSFFFHRYQKLINNQLFLAFLNVILFSYAHIVFNNWIAVIFTLAGGYLFTTTYLKTKSLFLTWLEHSLYGCLIFTSGLGWFFYKGTSASLEIIKTIQI